MRICLLTRYFDFRNAGLGRVSSEIANNLVKHGHSVVKVSTEGNSLYSYFYYTLVEIPMKLPRKDVDAYHAITPMEAMWIPKRKSVVTFHDLFQITSPKMLGSGLGYSYWKRAIGTNYFQLASEIATRCHAIVSVSEKTRQELIEYLNVKEHRIRVIKSGIRPDLQPRPKNNGTFKLGYLGQLDRRKRVNLLVESFSKSKIDGELVVGGTGIDEPQLKELAGEDTRIKFLGLVPDDRLVEFYNALDMFVFPTMLEGYGLPPVEAMACGIPTIVLSDSILPEEIKSRCAIAEDLDSALSSQSQLESLTKTIDYKENYRFAKEHNWEICTKEYIKLYEEIAGV